MDFPVVKLFAPPVAALLAVAAVGARASEDAGFWRVAVVRGTQMHCLRGLPEAALDVWSCRERCGPVPWQLDERDPGGRLVLDSGPRPDADTPAGLLDDNDEVLFLYRDAGRRMTARERAAAGRRCLVEVVLRLPGGPPRRVYALRRAGREPRPQRRYVIYDPQRDLVRGARVALGFAGTLPAALHRVRSGELGRDLLDRLKLRASARFFGLIPLWRDEGDIESELVAWKAGPVRVIRRQRQWVRLGFGLRSPIFGSETAVYPDWAQLPVHLRLNFPPARFFRAIDIRARLDFDGFDGWRLLVPGLDDWVPATGLDARTRRRIRAARGEWFALSDGEVVLVNVLRVSPSLASVRRHIDYEDTAAPLPPEDVAGERPGIGYRLRRWEEVPAGRHWFAADSYALPAGWGVRRLLAELDHALQVRTRLLEDGGARAPAP